MPERVLGRIKAVEPRLVSPTAPENAFAIAVNNSDPAIAQAIGIIAIVLVTSKTVSVVAVQSPFRTYP